MIAAYDFKLPLSGKAIQWKPLDVGQQLDLGATYTGEQSKTYLSAAMYAARVCKYPGEGGDKLSCSLAEIKQWDEIDYTLFCEEVDTKESERYAAFKKRDEPKVLSMKLQRAAMETREAFAAAFKKLDEAIEAAKAIEQAGASPLTVK